MAKPILIIKFPFKSFFDLTVERRKIFAKSIKKDLNQEYHVILSATEQDTIVFDCVNDSKGLRDGDITKLINKYHNEIKDGSTI
jgi:hypothetical protein